MWTWNVYSPNKANVTYPWPTYEIKIIMHDHYNQKYIIKSGITHLNRCYRFHGSCIGAGNQSLWKFQPFECHNAWQQIYVELPEIWIWKFFTSDNMSCHKENDFLSSGQIVRQMAHFFVKLTWGRRTDYSVTRSYCCIKWDTRPQTLFQSQAWGDCVTRNFSSVRIVPTGITKSYEML